MTWIASIKNHIQANSLGVFGTNLFIGGMDDGQDMADPIVALASYSGAIQETMTSGDAVRQPMLHVAARGSGYEATEARIQSIFDLLEVITNQTVQGTAFVRVKPSTTVMYLGRDAQGRSLFSANFEVSL